MPTTGKEVKKREFFFYDAGQYTGATALENNIELSYRVETNPGNTQGPKNITRTSSSGDRFKNVYSRINFNSRKKQNISNPNIY